MLLSRILSLSVYFPSMIVSGVAMNFWIAGNITSAALVATVAAAMAFTAIAFSG